MLLTGRIVVKTKQQSGKHGKNGLKKTQKADLNLSHIGEILLRQQMLAKNINAIWVDKVI